MLDLVWDGKAPGTTRLDDQASLQAERTTRYVGDRQARAIGLKDAGRRQKLAIVGGFPGPVTFSAKTVGEK